MKKSSNIKILIRFDDICPTMNWEQWERAVTLLDRYDIKPLIGVIPDNLDPDLEIDKPREDFWDYIRTLQRQGFTIAMHGYKHIFECGHSEFAGLPYEEQLYKIKEGKRILKEHGIETDVFFAPAHNFDDNTLRALFDCGFKYVSDGMSRKPYKRHGITLLPCRSGGIPNIKNNSGYVTAVVHAHEWVREDKKADWVSFNSLLEKNEANIVTFDEFSNRKLGNAFLQRADGILYYSFVHFIKPMLVKIIRKLR